MKKIFSIILSFVFLFMMSFTAVAADNIPEVTFNGNTELFSYKNVETAPNGNPQLFFGFEGAIPGDSFSQDIEFNTKNINGKTVHVYLHSENPNEDYNEIMELVVFKVFYEGEEISAGTLADGIKLGTFTGNGKRDFTVEFSIPLEVDNRIEKLYGTIDWVFIAELIEDEVELTPTPTPTPKPEITPTPNPDVTPTPVITPTPNPETPQTGDSNTATIAIIAVMLIALSGIIAVMIYKKKKS